MSDQAFLSVLLLWRRWREQERAEEDEEDQSPARHRASRCFVAAPSWIEGTVDNVVASVVGLQGWARLLEAIWGTLISLPAPRWAGRPGAGHSVGVADLAGAD